MKAYRNIRKFLCRMRACSTLRSSILKRRISECGIPKCVVLICAILALGCLSLTACGGKTGDGTSGNDGTYSGQSEAGEQSASTGQPAPEQPGGTGAPIVIMDLQSETEELFPEESPEESNLRGRLRGLQYYQGEIIRLRTETRIEFAQNEEGKTDILYLTNVYLDREDGSSELLFENMTDEHGGENWYMAQDGSVYCTEAYYGENNLFTLVKYDGEGTECYEKRLDMGVRDMCQLKDGTMILLLDDGGGLNSRLRLGELNQDTGEVTELSQIQLDSDDYYIGAGQEGLLVLDRTKGIWEADIRDGSRTNLLEFENTSYQLTYDKQYGGLKDIRLLENGAVELLWEGVGQGIRESLAWKQMDRISVVMRGFHFNNGWIKEAVADFNRNNDTYFISLEAAGGDWDDFATQTSVQIATGGGPALLYGEVLSDYIQGMLDKGGFENLTPYMERSGIREEDYFPMAFSTWRQGENIYAVNASSFVYGCSMDASVLGGNVGEMDIETLVNALYDYKENAMYMLRYGGGDILESFLGGSEDFWGMLDWEEGSCDFDTELFRKMMEVAKRYAYDENREWPILASQDYASGLQSFWAPSVLEQEGRVMIGTLFDDGCYGEVNSAFEVLSINVNAGAAEKEGAWEFIAYLLGEEGQRMIAESDWAPVNKNAFRELAEKSLNSMGAATHVGTSRYIRGEYVTEFREVRKEAITEEWMDAFLEYSEEARPLPVRTKPLLAIICEETEDYFKGIKGLEDVIGVMENRVRLYLNEHSF